MTRAGTEPYLTFSVDDVRLFAARSGDHNPLHVDPEFARQTHFGEQVVHGVLTALETLAGAAAACGGRPLGSIEIEFRGAVRIGRPYERDAECRDGNTLTANLREPGQLVLAVRAALGPASEARPTDLSWIGAAQSVMRQTPVARTLDELKAGVEVTGTYELSGQGALPGAPTVSPVQAQTLALCSYLTGMEVPGLRSLFTRISLSFFDDPGTSPALVYRARTVRFDAQFRILDTELQVATPGGLLVATGLLRSYVPFSPTQADHAELSARLVPAASSLQGRVALVLGGTRGLGADVASALALAGCHTFVSARQDDRAGRELASRIQASGGAITFVQGDAGDAAWCASTLDRIRAEHGRLDLLVLNACAPPQPLRVAPETAEARASYVADNLKLVDTPLSVLCRRGRCEQGGPGVRVLVVRGHHALGIRALRVGQAGRRERRAYVGPGASGRRRADCAAACAANAMERHPVGRLERHSRGLGRLAHRQPPGRDLVPRVGGVADGVPGVRIAGDA